MHHQYLAAKPIGTLHLGSLSTGQIWTMWGVLGFFLFVVFGVAWDTWQGETSPRQIPITFTGALIISALGIGAATVITVVSVLHHG